MGVSKRAVRRRIVQMRTKVLAVLLSAVSISRQVVMLVPAVGSGGDMRRRRKTRQTLTTRRAMTD
jgi:hypothetical protein